MATNKKITQLTEITTPAANDVVPIVSVAGDVTSKIQYSNLVPISVVPVTVAQGGTGLTTLTSGSVLVGNGTGTVTLVATTGSGSFVRSTSPTITTPSISGDLTILAGASVALKNALGNATAFIFNNGGSGANIIQTASPVALGADLKIAVPTNVATSAVTTDGTQTLTNKSISGGQITSAVATATTATGANALYSATTTVGVSAATAPTSGQVLTATSSTAATWQTPAVGADGWTATSDVWTYASASTVNVPSGAANLYGKGDRIKFTQTTVKYFTIVAVADTLLTLAVNTNFVVVNAAISAISYSHEASPVGYPTWFDFQPTWTGFSVAPVGTIRYSIVGQQCFILSDDREGTSNATTLTFTIPVTVANNNQSNTLFSSKDNGAPTAAQPGQLVTTATSNAISIFRSIYQTAWTNSGQKGFYGISFFVDF